MKAKLFIGLAVAVVAIAATTIFAVNHFSPKSHLSDLALQNLEAITDNENSTRKFLKERTDDCFIFKGNEKFIGKWQDCVLSSEGTFDICEIGCMVFEAGTL
jgi:hypothetical protein